MEKRNLSVYDSDKDTARVRRHAERSTYVLSVAYLIFMFFMTRIIHFPLWASLCYPGVFVIGSFLFFCKKIPRSIYQYWFAASSAGLCALFAVCSDTFTKPEGQKPTNFTTLDDGITEEKHDLDQHQ